MRLSHKEYAALDQAIFELYDYRDLKRFRAEAPAIFLKLVPSDYFFWPELALPPAPDGVSALVDFVESAACMTSEKAGEIAENIMSHPFTCYFMNGGQPMALKLSDFLTQSQLQRSDLGKIYQRWGGFRYNLSLSVATGRGRASAVGFCNSNRDFTERDRFVLGLMQRHFDRAHCNARLASSQLQFPRISFKDFALTPREAEVAIWLAQGKTNQEISMILCGCVRTIEKHVEQILKKLHAENRATAAVLINSAVNSRTSV